MSAKEFSKDCFYCRNNCSLFNHTLIERATAAYKMRKCRGSLAYTKSFSTNGGQENFRWYVTAFLREADNIKIETIPFIIQMVIKLSILYMDFQIKKS